MHLEEVQYNILQSGREDYTYLYEIVWGLNHFTEVSAEDRFRILKEVLLQLFDEEKVAFFWCEMPWNNDNLVKMTMAGTVRSSIQDEACWHPPSEQGTIRYVTTEKGIPLLNALIAQGFHKRFWTL